MRATPQSEPPSRLNGHAQRAGDGASARALHVAKQKVVAAAELAHGTADQRKSYAGLVANAQRAYAHLLGQEIGRTRAEWLSDAHDARLEMAGRGPERTDTLIGWARSGVRRLAADLRAAKREFQRDLASIFHVLHEEPAEAERIAHAYGAPLKLVFGAPLTPALLEDASRALPKPRDLDIIAVTASTDRDALTLYALPMLNSGGQAVNAIRVHIDGHGRISGRMEGIAADGERAAEIARPLAPAEVRALIARVIREARHSGADEGLRLGAGAAAALRTCAAAAALPPV